MITRHPRQVLHPLCCSALAIAVAEAAAVLVFVMFTTVAPGDWGATITGRFASASAWALSFAIASSCFRSALMAIDLLTVDSAVIIPRCVARPTLATACTATATFVGAAGTGTGERSCGGTVTRAFGWVAAGSADAFFVNRLVLPAGVQGPAGSFATSSVATNWPSATRLRSRADSIGPTSFSPRRTYHFDTAPAPWHEVRQSWHPLPARSVQLACVDSVFFGRPRRGGEVLSCSHTARVSIQPDDRRIADTRPSRHFREISYRLNPDSSAASATVRSSSMSATLSTGLDFSTPVSLKRRAGSTPSASANFCTTAKPGELSPLM